MFPSVRFMDSEGLHQSPRDEADVSMMNLVNVSCSGSAGNVPTGNMTVLTSFGREFLRVVLN